MTALSAACGITLKSGRYKVVLEDFGSMVERVGDPTLFGTKIVYWTDPESPEFDRLADVHVEPAFQIRDGAIDLREIAIVERLTEQQLESARRAAAYQDEED